MGSFGNFYLMRTGLTASKEDIYWGMLQEGEKPSEGNTLN